MFNQIKSRRTQLFSQSDISRRTGPWKPEEDERLLKVVSELGIKHWKLIGIRHGSRDGKQCRERWHNHLNPELIYGPLTPEEDEQILTFYSEIGTKWAVMSQLLRRPANLIKNRYYSSLSKKRNRTTFCSENSSMSRKRIKEVHTVNSHESFQFNKSGKVPFDHNKEFEQSWTLNDQTGYHGNYLDFPRTPAWSSCCSNNSTYFELPMTKEPLTPTYTPVTSPEPSFYHCKALKQLADLAIEKSSKEFHNNNNYMEKYNIMSISAVLN